MSSLLATLLALLVLLAPTNGLDPRKLDEVPGSPEIKCGTCNQSPPPPSSPPPAPLPPPPPPKKPPTPSLNCPPPPSYVPIPGAPSFPSYIPVPPGPPGNLYPVNPYISGCARSSIVGLPLLVAYGLLGFKVFW